jgi:hypothetical protein
MDLKSISFKVLGRPGSGGWASVYESDSGLISDPKGRLFIVVSSNLSEDVDDIISFGRDILVDLYKEYYNHALSSNFYGLKNAVEKTYAKYKDRFSGLEMGAASLSRDVLNCAVVGGAQAGVFRNKFLVKILVSSSPQVVSASGYPREDDLFILGTSAFFECFENSDFDSFLEKEKRGEDGLSLLREKASSFSNSSRLAGSFVYFSLQSLKIEEPIRLEKRKTIFQMERFVKRELFLPLERVINKILTKRGDSSFPRRKIYVRSTFQGLEDAQSRKKGFSLALFLIIFLSLSVLIGSKLKDVKEKRAFYQAKLVDASSKVEEAKKIASLDPEKSRELFFKAKDEVSLLKNEGIKDKKLQELDEDIRKSEESVLKEYHLEPELFLDLTLLTQGFKISLLKADANNILVLDRNGKRLVKISFENKKTGVVSGPDDFDNYQDVGLYSGDIFVLTSKAIFNVKDNKKELSRNDFGDDALINFYAGNAYILDKNPSRIYRLAPDKEGFSLPQIWTGEGIKVDFTSAKYWFIDGFVWVLIDNNQILKFSRGVPERVYLKGVYPALEVIDSIYSNDELKFVYLLDSRNGRVVVVDKNGNYVCQYVADKIKSSNFLVVSESQKKAVFSLSDGKLYSFDLKHL